MKTLNVFLTDKWPSFGILIAFAVANWALVYFFVYTVRIRRWTFGVSTVAKVLSGIVEKFRGGKQKEAEHV